MFIFMSIGVHTYIHIDKELDSFSFAGFSPKGKSVGRARGKLIYSE